ncbi:hypothetical protein [Pontibacillus yanchengensis]|uniref:Permease n=1 Tax=Pontibacillus yanchengensis Y32 TaxID=1385514 RepID=A0A0A2T8Y9_9BACI|nr:hypothetical protein [Pontibacillus yanchengensis]KGP70838.1 hypothetical protein N782_02930 [Pontibacillus yanchengensis Y32]
MGKALNRLFAILICTYAVIHFIVYFSKSETFSINLSLIGICAFLLSFFFLKIQKASISLFLTTVAVLLHMISGSSLMEGFLSGFRVMSGLISLLIIVPMISWVLREESYIESVIHFAQNILNTSRRFYFGMMFITQLISFFLLFGAIPMVYQMVNDFLHNQKGEAWENYKSTAILRGFALTTMWVVSIPSFLFAVDHLGASLPLSMLQGALLSLVGILLSTMFSYFQEQKYGVSITEGIKEELERIGNSSNNQFKDKRYVYEFAILFISLFGTIFLIKGLWNVKLLLLIPITIIVWIIIYFLVKKRAYKLGTYGKRFVQEDLPKQAQQYSILLAAGFLVDSVKKSGAGTYMVDGMFYVADAVPFLNFLWILPLIVVLLGFIGLGPLTVIVLVSGILEGVSLPYPPEVIVIGITSGSVISIMLSPLILPVIVLSTTNQLGTIKNGFHFNIGYAISFYFLVQLYIQVVVHVFF